MIKIKNSPVRCTLFLVQGTSMCTLTNGILLNTASVRISHIEWVDEAYREQKASQCPPVAIEIGNDRTAPIACAIHPQDIFVISSFLSCHAITSPFVLRYLRFIHYTLGDWRRCQGTLANYM